MLNKPLYRRGFLMSLAGGAGIVLYAAVFVTVSSQKYPMLKASSAAPTTKGHQAAPRADKPSASKVNTNGANAIAIRS